MASIYKIVFGPEFSDLIFALTLGRKIRFTFNPQGVTGFNGVLEAQLRSWSVVGGYKDREIEISGRILSIKEPRDLSLKTAYLNFQGLYNARTRKGEITVRPPDED